MTTYAQEQPSSAHRSTLRVNVHRSEIGKAATRFLHRDQVNNGTPSAEYDSSREFNIPWGQNSYCS